MSGQDCSRTFGNLTLKNTHPIIPRTTYIFTDSHHTVSCNGTVIAWEFCFQGRKQSTNVLFYADIWSRKNDNGRIHFALINSSNISFSLNGSNADTCLRVNLSEVDQFIAPAGSFIGLHSGSGVLQAPLNGAENVSSNRTTYRFEGENNEYLMNNRKPIDYYVEIKLYLG